MQQDCTLHMVKKFRACAKPNHFNVVYKSTHEKQPDQQVRRAVHEISQEDRSHIGKEGEQDRSFDAVRVKYINLDSMKSVIFTKLEPSTSQRRTQITYKIDSQTDGT